MSYTPKQWRAIKLYADKHNAIPQLSAFPNLRFMDRETRQFTTIDVFNLELQYEAHKEEEKRQKAQERRESAKRDKADKNAARRATL